MAAPKISDIIKDPPFGLSMKVLPKQHNRVAIYRMAGLGKIDPRTKKPIRAQPTVIAGSYMFSDPHESQPHLRDKVVENVTGNTIKINKDGKRETVPKVEDILVPDGFVMINPKTQYNSYIFWELHPNNGSNRFRPNHIEIYFSRVDRPSKTTQQISVDHDLLMQAVNLASGLKHEQLKRYALSLKNKAGKQVVSLDGVTYGDLRNQIRDFAQQNPRQFLTVSEDLPAVAKMHVHDARRWELISYDTDKRTWDWIYTPDDQAIKMMTHNVDEDPFEALAKWLLDDPKGQEKYSEILNILTFQEEASV